MKDDKNDIKLPMRIDKYLSNCGISARRNISEILQNHVITINGKRVKEAGIRFDPSKDRILLDGEEIAPSSRTYILINKPKGIISTASDEYGRKTVLSLVPSKQRLYPVGRLDQDTTGLLLLTNDGALANRLTHPRYHIPKIYELTIRGSVSEQKLAHFRRGVKLEDGMTSKAQAQIIQEREQQTVVEVILHEGKKRQIRRMCEALRLPLLDLKRVQIGPILLGDLPEGSYRSVTKKELEILKKEAYKKG